MKKGIIISLILAIIGALVLKPLIQYIKDYKTLYKLLIDAQDDAISVYFKFLLKENIRHIIRLISIMVLSVASIVLLWTKTKTSPIKTFEQIQQDKLAIAERKLKKAQQTVDKLRGKQ